MIELTILSDSRAAMIKAKERKENKPNYNSLIGDLEDSGLSVRITRTPFIVCNSCNHYCLPCQVPHTLGLTCDLGFNWSACTCMYIL